MLFRSPAAALQSAITVFTWIGAVGIAAGVVFLVVGPFIRHWGEAEDEAAERVGVSYTNRP